VGDSTTPANTTPVAPPGTTPPAPTGPAAAAAPKATASDPKAVAAPKTDAAKADTAKTDTAKTDAAKTDTAKTDAAKTDAPKTDGKADDVKPVAADPAAGLASLGPLAGPLLNTAVGVPAAALQGAGQLIPGLAGAVMPTLAALLSQLGTSTTPAAPSSRISGYPNAVAGPLSGLAGTGAAADSARDKTSALAREIAGLKEVEQKLGAVLDISSAKTDTARATLNSIIREVETAIRAAAVQGDTPEARAAVLTAMRQALANAGSVVSAAARDKMTDAQFVRQLINDYLSGTGGDVAAGSGAVHLLAGSRGGGRGAIAVAAARRYLGTPYVWGGGGTYGPTKGGFDCSGLTQYAVAKASGGRMILPRTTYEQIRCGRAVPLTGLRPGDLVFSNFSSPGVPEHVQLYIGAGQVIEAPQRGVPVQISSLPSNAQARRVL
jgi:cell wall-associated NlpC family hydrolase